MKLGESLKSERISEKSWVTYLSKIPVTCPLGNLVVIYINLQDYKSSSWAFI